MISYSDLLDKLPNAKQYGNYIACTCLWHDDTNPSLLVYPDGYRCLSCGARGTISKLLRKLDGLPEVAARPVSVDSRNPWSGWLRERTLEEFVSEAYWWITRYPDQGIDLYKRGITRKIITDLHIGWSDGYYIFPIFSMDGTLRSAVARAGATVQQESGVRYILPRGSEAGLFVPSWEMVRVQRTVRVPFGIVDAVTLFALGYASATGTVGKNYDPEWFRDIRKSILILPDAGEEDAAYKLAAGLGWRGKVKRLDYPLDCKDPNEILQRHGVEALNLLLA